MALSEFLTLPQCVSKKGIDDSEFYAIHVEAVKKLCEAAEKRKVKRFINCSTIGVLGDIKNPPADETAPYNAVDIYQKTKAKAKRWRSHMTVKVSK